MYKYLPPERIDVLVNNLICFNNPVNFNDPFEFHTTFDFVHFNDHLKKTLSAINLLDELPKEYIEKINQLDNASRNLFIENAKSILPQLYQNYKPVISEQVENTFARLNDEFIKITRVLSLSSDPKNILMWGHYAAAHSGFIIEFNKNHHFFNQQRSDKDEYGFLREVIYQNEIPCMNPLIDRPVNHFLTKSTDWLYEKEWRMLLPEHYANQKIIFDNKNFDLFHLPSDAIKNVILGCRISPTLEKDISDILSQRSDYKHVNILKAKRSNDRFEVLI